MSDFVSPNTEYMQPLYSTISVKKISKKNSPKNEKKKIGMQALKIAIGSSLAIYIANLFGLKYSPS